MTTPNFKLLSMKYGKTYGDESETGEMKIPVTRRFIDTETGQNFTDEATLTIPIDDSTKTIREKWESGAVIEIEEIIG